MKALVLVLRGLSAGAIGPYGNRWIETPTLDALAARGVVYDWHFAVSPDHDEARRAWESGRYCPGLTDSAGDDSSLPGLIDVLNARGVRTSLLTGAHSPSPEWATAWESSQTADDVTGAIDAARDDLARLAGEDTWLLWVELSGAMPPWDISDEALEAYFAPPAEAKEDEVEEDEEDAVAEEYLDEEPAIEPLLFPPPGRIDPADDVLYRRIQTTFAAAVTQLDLMLAELLEAVGDDVLVVVTSDHGQALGERGFFGPCRPWLHEELVHVPLILAGPGCPPGRRIAALTASIDLAPTLAAYFGAPFPETHGHDLHPAVVGDGEGLREYVCLSHQIGEAAEWGLRTREWAFRLPHGGERPCLYVKPDDRCEVNDVCQHHPDLAESLERTLRAFVEATRAPGPLVPPPLELTTPAPTE